MKNVKLFAMPNSKILGEKIAKELKIELTGMQHTKFLDGESLLVSEDTVRNKDVFVVASTCPPANNNIMELLIFIDSLKRASANKITVVLSYYGYARQDRKAAARQPIGAKLVADILEAAGTTKLITLDLHNPAIQAFFTIPIDELRGQYILAEKIKKYGDFKIVSPDHGGAVRARVLSDLISKTPEIAIIDKRRTGPNQAEAMGILGDVKDKNVVIIDDMIDTGGTIIKASETLKKNGAKKIIVAATHGIFTKGFEAFENSEDIDKVMVSDSIEKVYELQDKFSKLEIVTASKMIANVITSIVKEDSISLVYKKMMKKIDEG